MNTILRFCFALLALFMLANLEAQAQGLEEQQHKRGRLWENVRNDGWIGSLGAWDYLVSAPLGLFPGFEGYTHPVGNEENAIDTYANANMHNFRSGCWIVVKDILVPGNPPDFRPTPAAYEVFLSGLQEDTYGIAAQRDPLQLKINYIESAGFNPLLPEEMIDGRWHTNTGITVFRRSYVWSYPNYRAFIIYDYIFKNTGMLVSTLTGAVMPDFPAQTLKDVYFVFHSGISVSTKSQINFHSELTAVQAGAFGWQPGAYHDYYHKFDDGALVFSTNFNGGKAPAPFDPFPLKPGQAWKQKFGEELQSPAAFGWLALFASPTGTTPRPSPKPDFLRIDSHKLGTLPGQNNDLEFFRISSGKAKKLFFDFATTPDTQAALGNNGNRLNFYTFSYGPYTLAPGDSVRIVVAEIAGVMDYKEVIAGDPNNHFPDSTIAAIRRNAAHARNAVRWGIGATEGGIPLAADAPEPPPGPNTDAVNASLGTEEAAIAITWDKIAEETRITDGAGTVFYDGLNDLDGYRIYRSTDFQFVSDDQPPVLRGAAWQLLIDIPKSDFAQHFDASLGKYKYSDQNVAFGFRYGYYVSAYRKQPKPWTSANGTVVNNLPELASGDYNRTPPASAAPGPVSSFDIYVVPNPFVFNDANRSFSINDPYRIEFRNLPERCTIRIYTLSGDLIRTIEHQPDARGNVSGSEAWDQKSDSGLLVAPGLYIYHVQSKTPELSNALTGKLMLVR